MADHAPNFTARYRVRYSTVGAIHRMQFRFARGFINTADAAAKAKLFLDQIAALRWPDWTVLGADFALTDSDIFLPALPPLAVAGTANFAATTQAARAAAISFLGRSANGKRAAMYVYGTSLYQNANAVLSSDFRATSAEVAQVASGVGALNDSTIPLVGNDGATVTWYPYVNIKYNDHWVRKLRSG